MTDADATAADAKNPAPDMVLRYRNGVDGVIDVYLPPADVAAPRLVVAVHGGFWRAAYDRRHLRPFAAALARRSAVVAVPEFRRVGAGGEWPVIGYDVEAALGHIPELLSAQRLSGFDPHAPGTLVGHSAGGHLALWAGLRAGRARVERIVALAPVSDLYAADSAGLGRDAVRELLGESAAERPDRFADADPLRLLPGGVSTTIVQGTADTDVPAWLNRAVANAHPTIAYRELAAVDHMSLIDPDAAVCREIVLPIVAGG